VTGASTAGRPRRADARRNYDRLLDTARQVFAERGADASLDEIARRAGVGPGTLYRHFPNRAELLSAVLADWVEDIRGAADGPLAGLPPADALAGWLRLLHRHLTTYRGLAAFVNAEDPALSGVCTPIAEVGEAVLGAAQRAGAARADVAVRDMHRMVNGVAIATESLPPDSPEVTRLLDIIAAGLRP